MPEVRVLLSLAIVFPVARVGMMGVSLTTHGWVPAVGMDNAFIAAAVVNQRGTAASPNNTSALL